MQSLQGVGLRILAVVVFTTKFGLAAFPLPGFGLREEMGRAQCRNDGFSFECGMFQSRARPNTACCRFDQRWYCNVL